MKVSEKAVEILREAGLGKADGLCPLLCLHHGIRPSYIPDEVWNKAVGLFTGPDGDWAVPLFEGMDTGFQWAREEYAQIFTAARPDHAPYARETVARMRKLFAENPDFRKEEVLGAARMYVRNTDPRYVMRPHYFIQKGVGAAMTQTVIGWVEQYRKEQNKEAKTLRNRLL